MATLTKKQKEILDYIKKYVEKNGVSPTFEEIRKHFKKAIGTIHEHIETLIKKELIIRNPHSARGIEINSNYGSMVEIPFLGIIAAGEPITAIQENETIAVPKSKLPKDADVFALRVMGESMVDENIHDGDVILVKQQATAEDGEKVVALINNNEATLKKFYRESNHIRLQPANKTFDPIIIKKNEDIEIQGIVIDIIKSIGENRKNTIETNKDQTSNNDLDFIPNKIICSDCLAGLKKIPDNSIDGCVTDPPYNYEFIGHKWDANEIKRRTERIKNSKTLIKHIPYGSGLAGGVRNERWYEKNTKNIIDYQNWCHEWGKEVFRILKPGAYIFVFNSSRTIAHVQVAMEKAGFYARDIIVWKKNSGIPKGLNFTKKLQKEGITNPEKWNGWHSCLRSEWEAIVLLQKPLINNYLETIKEFGVGLLHAQNGNGRFQSNILEDIKREKKEYFNIHCTIKPTELVVKLIDLIIPPGKEKIVLDPFMGSGTTAIAAIEKNISYFGFEINEEYCNIANKRIENFLKKKGQKLF